MRKSRILEVVLFIVSSVLIMIWYDWRLLVILWAWSFANNMQRTNNRMEATEKANDRINDLLKGMDGMEEIGDDETRNWFQDGSN